MTTLRGADYDAMRREVPQVVRASAIVSTTLRLKAGEYSKVSAIIGCEPSYFAIKGWPLADGTVFDEGDIRRAARIALVGHTVAADLYGAESAVGRRLFINRVPFIVGGVLSERGQGLDVADEDQQVYVPLTTAMRRLTNVDYFNAVIFEIRSWSEMDRATADLSEVMRRRHRAAVTGLDDFLVESQKELVDTQVASSVRLAFLVRWAAWCGLVVSGLGVVAIAWMAVSSRTTEVGTRRALGAAALDIFFQFAFEAGALAMLGSLSGLALGWVGTRIASTRTHLPFVFDAAVAVVAPTAALALNVLFSVWPAWRAALLDPADALRDQ